MVWQGGENEKDLRSFIKLCQKHGLFVVPRLGPWSHGEARNGGTPDWILQKKYLKDRSSDVVYQNYVKRYFAQIANQLKGLYYKDGGNIIGIQLENEYWYGKEGEPHIQWLKDTALENGIDVNSLYMTVGGKPILPVMGELHFSRIRKDLWEDRILKMKACGINIISTYLFWNHHEKIRSPLS